MQEERLAGGIFAACSGEITQGDEQYSNGVVVAWITV